MQGRNKSAVEFAVRHFPKAALMAVLASFKLASDSPFGRIPPDELVRMQQVGGGLLLGVPRVMKFTLRCVVFAVRGGKGVLHGTSCRASGRRLRGASTAKVFQRADGGALESRDGAGGCPAPRGGVLRIRARLCRHWC